MCEPAGLAGLVLGDLVQRVLAALGVLAVGVPLLGDVHLRGVDTHGPAKPAACEARGRGVLSDGHCGEGYANGTSNRPI